MTLTLLSTFIRLHLNEVLIQLLGKSKDSICRKAKSLGLTKSFHWTPEQDSDLAERYVQLSTDELMSYFNRSRDSILQRASQLGLKKGFDFHRHSDVSVLLNDSLVTMYWIGFLLADGYIDSKVIRARIKCHTSWGPSYQIPLLNRKWDSVTGKLI